jgi:hypothetical protein
MMMFTLANQSTKKDIVSQTLPSNKGPSCASVHS